ncbi:MAG: dTMP kinase [Candidatus Methylumidiphilus sp.]
MNKGVFITLEGGEGVGKSTNLGFVADFLRASGKQVVATREPGGTPVGEKIRAVFLGEGDIAPETELLLVFAARAQHLRDVIEPALAGGAWVVCDRYTDASYAYQGGGRGVDLAFIQSLERHVQRGRQPDLTLLLDAPVETGMARAKHRGPSDRMEAETLAFFGRVRAAYLQLAERCPARVKIVDAARPLDEVRADLAEHLRRLLAA